MSNRSSDNPTRMRWWLPLTAMLVLGACATAPETPAPEEKTEISEATLAAYERALGLLRDDEYAAAIEAFQDIAEANERLAGPWVNIGIAYRALDEPEKAVEALEAALERDRENGAAYNQLGLIHRHAGRFDEARRAYEEGIDENPEYAKLYRNLGILCDIYLQNPSCALENFRAYQERTDEDNETIERWIADVERRAQ